MKITSYTYSYLQMENMFKMYQAWLYKVISGEKNCEGKESETNSHLEGKEDMGTITSGALIHSPTLSRFGRSNHYCLHHQMLCLC